ncbi:MAG: hypothetical protein V3R65_10495 [Acidiferrobacterales bacterium]
MNSEATSCLWPRAIIDVIPSPGAHATTADILRNFDPDLDQAQSRLRLDVTHLQPVMGSPFHIAQHIKRRLGNKEFSKAADKEATLGVASDPYVAAYAASIARTGTIKAIAPWEVRSSLHLEPIENICQLTPELALKLRLVGIRTGAQIAEQPLAVIKRVLGHAGIALWRACRGETNAGALEIDDQYHSVRCRAVLPPRTSSQRSIHSHLRRVINGLLSILRNRQRIPTTISLSMQEQRQAAIEVGSLDIRCDELNTRSLVDLVKQVVARNWCGGAVHFVELTAQQLYDPSGQLELFDALSPPLPEI